MIRSLVKSILVIKLRHIGDVLLTVPVFRALRETFPDAHVSALVNAGTEAVLSSNPIVDEIIVFERSIKSLSAISRFYEELSFLRSISKRAFDMTVDLTGGDRAALVSFASGARYRIGLSSGQGFTGKKFLYTHLTVPDNRVHTVIQNLEIVKRFGINTEDLSVDFYFSDADRIFINKILEDHGVESGTSIVHVHPTSRWLFKCWQDEYMAEIIRWLLDMDITVAVTASPDTREMEKAGKIIEITGKNKGLIDLRGKTTLKQLGALSKCSQLFFGVDSAPMHIAAAVGTPVVALFGPSGAFHWGPWDNRGSHAVVGKLHPQKPYERKNGLQRFGMNTVIQRDWDCVPCGNDGCQGSKKSRCLDDIRPGEIKALIEEKLKDR